MFMLGLILGASSLMWSMKQSIVYTGFSRIHVYLPL
jgi:hypothetical protein